MNGTTDNSKSKLLRRGFAAFAAASALLLAGGCADIRQAIDDALGGWTKEYTRTYSREIGAMMGPRYDSLALEGRGIRIGVLDAGFGSLRSDPAPAGSASSTTATSRPETRPDSSATRWSTASRSA